MFRSRLTAGVRVGLVTAAATAGVLVGLGVRHDSAFVPFLLYGRALLSALTGFLVPPAVATVVGLLAHALWMLLWGICFTAVAASLRAHRLLLAAAVFSGIVGLVASTVLPEVLGATTRASLTQTQTLFFLALLAVALAAGTRLARA